jgi:methyl-accepting chemotaxis protein
VLVLVQSVAPPTARRCEELDRKFIDAANDAGATIAQAFEAAIQSRAISVDRLFDTNYEIIPGTNPAQYRSPSSDLCDRVLPGIQEPILDIAARVVFCAAVDRKAYPANHVPIHVQGRHWGAAVRLAYRA